MCAALQGRVPTEINDELLLQVHVSMNLTDIQHAGCWLPSASALSNA